MTRIPVESPIDYLVRRRFPLARHVNRPISLANVRNRIPAQDHQKHEVETYRAELRSKSPSELIELVKAERQKELAQFQAKAAADEAARFYNQPNAQADFGHYCLCANWTLDEAVALTFGKNPELVNWKSVEPLVRVSAFAKDYAKRRDLTQRAKWAKQLYDPVYPSIFLAWAKTRFPLPERLTTTALDNGISLKGWQELYEEALRNWKAQVQNLLASHSSELSAAAAALGVYRERVDELEALRQHELVEPIEKPLKTRERENLQMLALVGAMRGYGFDPEKRTTAVPSMARDLGDLDHLFSDDSIRNHLQEAANSLRPGWRERWKRKPS